MPLDREQLPDRDLLELLDEQLGRYQAVITRLATNSVQVKTWCVTALAALVALAANNDQPELLAVGAVLLVAFFFLDAYYLSLERHFRRASAALVDQVAEGRLSDWRSLFKVEGPSESLSWRAITRCGRSMAISPFYVGVGVLLLVGVIIAW